MLRYSVVLGALLLACGSAAEAPLEDDGTDSSATGSSSSSGRAPASSSSGHIDDDGVSSSSSSGGSSGGGLPGCENVVNLRIVAGNLTDASQNYDDGRGLRIFKGLSPDIALVQELNFGNNSDQALQSFKQQGFGDDFTIVRGRRTNNSDIPNGIVSRYPLLESGEVVDPSVDNRTFVWARVDVPGPRDLLVFSVHLLTRADRRGAETVALMAAIADKVQGDEWVVLGGDFNTDDRTDVGVSTMAARFEMGGPYPVAEDDLDGTNNSRQKPYDWVVADAAFEAQSRATVIGSLQFSHGLVFDSRVFSDLSLTPGVQENDSAPLQHMAVVRDFAVCDE